MVRTERGRWNHNIHYHRLVTGAAPEDARTALDVGTGNGLLAADLQRMVRTVTAVDLDGRVVDSARAVDPSVRWVHGDVLTHPFPPASFDVVASVATVHHLPDPERAFRRFAELVAPGGVVVVIGLARSTRPVDLAFDVVGTVQHAVLRRRYGYWEHTAPTVWPPVHSYAQVRAAARTALPGCSWRRLGMWRYHVRWVRPRSGAARPAGPTR